MALSELALKFVVGIGTDIVTVGATYLAKQTSQLLDFGGDDSYDLGIADINSRKMRLLLHNFFGTYHGNLF